jgi:hypothetical protein
MKASSLCFKAAVLFVIAGMIWGLQMAISDNHSTYPAHAHLNLLGWVSLFLIGIYYRLHPALERSKAAMVQIWIWIAGTIVQAIGVGMIYTGRPAGEPAAGGGSFLLLASVLVFAWLVFRAEANTGAVAQPAE